MKFVPNTVSRKVAHQILVTQKNSPALLLGFGVAGVLTSTVLACRATLKLDEVIEETDEKLAKAENLQHKDYTEADRVRDKRLIRVQGVMSIAKLYGPAIVIGGISIGALVSSHNILSKRNAALTSAYVALEGAFAEYRKRVAAEFGADKEREVFYASKEVTTVDEKGKRVTMMAPSAEGGSIYARMFDNYNQNWSAYPEISLMFIRMQKNTLNDRLKARGHVFLNEVYDELGLDRTEAGQFVGWVWGCKEEKDGHIDFGFEDEDKMEAYYNFASGREDGIMLDFNVDGPIHKLIEKI